MADVMKVWLSLSLSGSLMILVLWLGRKWFQEKFTRRWQYYIWLLVIARLWIPLAPPQNLVGSLFWEIDRAGTWMEETAKNQIKSETQTQVKNQTKLENQAQSENQMKSENQTEWKYQTDQTAQADSATAAPPTPARILKTLVSLTIGLSSIVKTAARSLGVLWLAGACFLLLHKILLYRRFTTAIKTSWSEPIDFQLLERFGQIVEQSKIKSNVRLYTNPRAASPLMIGFRHPCIVLPTADLPESDFTYTILHELTHLKRLDLYYKWLVQITVCAHWFNPLVHLMAKEIGRTCELSCDEAVIKYLDENGRRAYGDTLLHAVSMGCGWKNNLASVTLYEGKELLKERLGAIMSYGKKSKPLMAFTFACTILLAAGTISTGAYAATKAEYNQSQEQWESRSADGKVTHSCRQDGYYEAPYIIELGWNLSDNAYASYPGKVDISLKNGDVIKAAFDQSCASFSNDEAFLTALTTLTERLNGKRLNSHFNFKMERLLVQRVQDVSGQDLSKLAAKFYEDRDLTSFNAIFPSIDKGTQDALCEKIYEDSNIAFFSTAVSKLDSVQLDRYAQRAYEDDRISFFADISWALSEEKAASYASQAFQDGKNVFFGELLPYLAKEEVRSYAERTYQSGDIATFTIVADYLSDEDFQNYKMRAKQDGKVTFSTVLSDLR